MQWPNVRLRLQVVTVTYKFLKIQYRLKVSHAAPDGSSYAKVEVFTKFKKVFTM